MNKIMLYTSAAILILSCLSLMSCEPATKPDSPTAAECWLEKLEPNPMPEGGSCEIVCGVKDGLQARLAILNSVGQELRDWNLTAGTSFVNWDGKDRHGNICASGVYYCLISTGSHSISLKMLVARAK